MEATIFDGHTQRPFTHNESQALTTTTPYAWVDIVPSGSKDPEVLALLTQMGFTDVVAAYTARTYSSGMFLLCGDNMLASTYAAPDEPGPPTLIHCVWNAGCFVTIRQGADHAIAQALEDFEPRAVSLFAQPGPVPGILLQLILDSIERQLTALQTQVAMLDGEIIVTANPSQLAKLQQVRIPVSDLGTTIPAYLQNLNESLIDPGSLPGMDAQGAQALQTYAACVNDVVQRITSTASDIRNAIEDYQGQVSSVQGNRINQLTLVSIIFLPISFMTGYFGQNFQLLTDATVSFTAWFFLGVALPIIVVIVSVALLQRSGFSIGKTLHFRTRSHREHDS